MGISRAGSGSRSRAPERIVRTRLGHRTRPTDGNPCRSGEEGAALLAALVALVAITALATGGIWLSGSNFQSSDAFSDGGRAFYAADAALQEFLGTHGVYPPDSATYDFGDGETAVVRATRLDHEPDVYRVEATGRVSVGGEVVSTRILGVSAVVDMGPLPEPTGNMFSPHGIEKSGASGEISGYDHYDPDSTSLCADDTTTEDLNGVVVSDSAGYDQSGDLVPEGDPNDVLEKDKSAMLDSLDLSWDSVVSGQSVDPDVTVDPDDMSNWPDFDTVPADSWPIIYATGKDKTLSLDAGHSGHGLLLTRGALSMNGSFEWDGLMYVGGEITAGTGDQTIRGAMFTGLNLLLGESVSSADAVDGTKTFRYHSCYQKRARGATAHLSAVPGSWYQSEERSN